MEKKNFLDGMARLMVAFPGQVEADKSELRSAVYLEALAGLTNAQWDLAVKRAIATEKWFPPAALLLEYAGESKTQRKTKAVEAFSAMFDGTYWLAEIGRSRLVEKFGPVAYQALIASGGPAAFDHARDSDRPFLEKRFLEAYEEAETELRRNGELTAVESLKQIPARVRGLIAGSVREFPAVVKR